MKNKNNALTSFPGLLLCQVRCAVPVDIVTERVKGTIPPDNKVLLEVPDFDEPLLHVRRYHSVLPQHVKLDQERNKPDLLPEGNFFLKNNQKSATSENLFQVNVNEHEPDLFPFADERQDVRRKSEAYQGSEMQ